MNETDELEIKIGELLQVIHLSWLRLGSERLKKEERETLLNAITTRQWELMEFLELKWAREDQG